MGAIQQWLRLLSCLDAGIRDRVGLFVDRVSRVVGSRPERSEANRLHMEVSKHGDGWVALSGA